MTKMKFCQFCGDPAKALVERIADGKPLWVCGSCWRDTRTFPIYRDVIPAEDKDEE